MIAAQHFDAALDSPRQARHFVHDCLNGLDAETVNDVTLMVSEVATNAVRHARSGFELRIDRRDDSICVEIRDYGDGVPVPQTPSPQHATGRGLRIVATLADEWSVCPDVTGKTIRFCKHLSAR